MLRQTLRIHLFVAVFSVNVFTQEYYYARRGPYFDVVYGERPLDSDFKKVKSPKLLNYNYVHSDEGMTECDEVKFTCSDGPYSRSQTAAFECSLDHQCPGSFKCCENACFKHKICQPAKPIKTAEGKEIIRTSIPEPQNTTTPRSSVIPRMTTSVNTETKTSDGKDATENSSMLSTLETSNADMKTSTDGNVENSTMKTSAESLNRTTFQTRTRDSTSSDVEDLMTISAGNEISMTTISMSSTISEDETTITTRETDTTISSDHTTRIEAATSIGLVSEINKLNITETLGTMTMKTDTTISGYQTNKREMTSEITSSITQIPDITKVNTTGTSDMMTQKTNTMIYTGHTNQSEAVSSITPVPEIVEVNTTETLAMEEKETGSTIYNRTTRTEMLSSTEISGNQITETEMRSTQASTSENVGNIEIQTDSSLSTPTVTTPSLVGGELSSTYGTNMAHFDATEDTHITDIPLTETTFEPPNTESIQIKPENSTSSSEKALESNITNITRDDRELMTINSGNKISVTTISMSPTMEEEGTTMTKNETNITMSNDHTTLIEIATSVVPTSEFIESNVAGKTDSTICDNHTTRTGMTSDMTALITEIPEIILEDITETMMTQGSDAEIYTGHTNQTEVASSITPISEIIEVYTTGKLATIWTETGTTISDNHTIRTELTSYTTSSENNDDEQTLINTVVDNNTTSSTKALDEGRIETIVTQASISTVTSMEEYGVFNTNSLNTTSKTSEVHIDRTMTTNGGLKTEVQSLNTYSHIQTEGTPSKFEDKQETSTMPKEDVTDVTSENTRESITTDNIDRITTGTSDRKPIVQSKFAIESNKNREINISGSAVEHDSTIKETSSSVPSKLTHIDENDILSEITTISSFITSKSIYSQENKINMSDRTVEGYTSSKDQATRTTDLSPVDGEVEQTEQTVRHENITLNITDSTVKYRSPSDDSTSEISTRDTEYEVETSTTSAGSSPNPESPKPTEAAENRKLTFDITASDFVVYEPVLSISNFVMKYFSDRDSDKSNIEHSSRDEVSKNRIIDSGFIPGEKHTENETRRNSEIDKYSKTDNSITTVDEEQDGSGSIEGSGIIEGSGSIEGSGKWSDDDDDDDDDDDYDFNYDHDHDQDGVKSVQDESHQSIQHPIISNLVE